MALNTPYKYSPLLVDSDYTGQQQMSVLHVVVYFGWVWNIHDLFFLKILEVKSKYGQLRWKESKYMKFIVVSFDAYVSCGSLHISKIKYGQLKWNQSRLIGLAVHLLVLANECIIFGLFFLIPNLVCFCL